MASLAVETERQRIKRRVERPLETFVLIAAVATIPLVAAGEWGGQDNTAGLLDWLIWLVFLADYLILMALSEDRRSYARSNWLSLVIVVVSCPVTPSLLALVRLARLERLLRLLRLLTIVVRGLQALRVSLGRPGLIYMALTTFILVLAAGAILVLIEPETVKGDFYNGVWWAVVTATTVGYGDITPVTPGGRLLGAVLMLIGIGLVATLAATISAHFVHQDVGKREETDFQELSRRLERIEALLREGGAGVPDNSESQQPE